MKSLSTEFKQALYYGDRNYLAYADITLANNTVLHMTNSEIWTGGFEYEESISEDDSFGALGSAVIGSATIIINNIDEQYSSYDFTNANAVLYVGMQFGQTLEKIKIGTYTVDETVYNGATIRLTLLDYMEQFDRPYSLSSLVYPATLSEIVVNACQVCGVTLGTQNFPHKEYEIEERPSESDTTTFREVLSWVATIAGCFVKCDPDGKLLLKWFDYSALDHIDADLDGGTFNPWSSGTNYSGGTFNPWSSGELQDGGDFTPNDYHHISALYTQSIAMDDVVITGVSVTLSTELEDNQPDSITYSTGTSGYMIEIEENPFFTQDDAQTIINWLGVQLIGLRFRKLNVSQLTNPAIESGDVGVVYDRKENAYKILITRNSFSIDGNQTIVCGASTPSRNSATRFSAVTKSYAESRKLLKQERSDRETAEAALATAIANSGGLYYTTVTENNATKYYLHNKPTLASSNIRILFSTAGITVTSDSGAHWYGLTVNGDMLINLLSATGINFDWAHGGTMTLGGQNNTNGKLRMLNASGQEIGSWNKDGITATNFTAYGSLICYESYTIS